MSSTEDPVLGIGKELLQDPEQPPNTPPEELAMENENLDSNQPKENETPKEIEDTPEVNTQPKEEEEEEDAVDEYSEDDHTNQNYSPQPPKSPRSESSRPRSRKPEKSLKQMALDLDPIDNLTEEQFDELLGELVSDRKLEASSHQFEQSDQINLAIEHVSHCQLQQRKLNFQKAAYADYQAQVEEFNQELKDFDDETKRLSDELLQKQQNRRESIQNAQEAELDRHYDHWNSRAVLRQYNTATNQLIILRKQFKLLICQCRFKEAQDVKAILQRTEAHEKAEAFKLMQNNYDESLKKIEKKHRDERSFFESNCVVQMKTLQQRRDRLRVALLNKMKKLQKKGEIVTDADKLWNLHQNERIEELSRDLGSKKGTNIATRLASTEVSENEGTTICLPPLNLRRKARMSTQANTVR